MTPAPSRGDPVPPRAALLSILVFWLFYLVIGTARSLVMPFAHPVEMAGYRTLVCAIGVVITLGLYAILRQAAGLGLRHAIAIAALASLPAALAYSAANWAVFYKLRDGPRARIFIQAPSDVLRAGATVGTDPVGREVPVRSMIVDQAMNGYFFMVAWCAFYLALASATAVRQAERRAARFHAAAQAAELRALRYQVSPHFLFNTLNSLSTLVLRDRSDEAERMIQNLATFFRTSLTSDPTADVTLAHEIELQRLYLGIEAIRFPDRLLVAVDVPAALEAACVPGLLLQPLVENAVKYGVARARRPVTVGIAAWEDAGRLAIAITDDGDPMGEAEAADVRGTGVGLANVADRIAARHGPAAAITYGPLPGGGWRALLTLPLVRHGC
ncbi:MAG: histidine kinase [Sphingomonas fennica]